MSGGTMLALASDEIVMDANAVLGPVDPQLGNFPAASILKVVEDKPIGEIDDQTLIMADLSRKAIQQVQRFVRTLLKDTVPQQKIQPENIENIVDALTTGRVTHDYPITVEEASEMGLPITVGLPRSIYDLMELYPQPQGGRPSVQYIPLPYGDRRPALPQPKGRPLSNPTEP
jgi:ClpP class serine protease